MRKMRNIATGTVLNIREHAILGGNLWEYYITDAEPKNTDIQFALVVGFETEMGDVSMSEIAEHVVSRCPEQCLDEIMPAPGWAWKDD